MSIFKDQTVLITGAGSGIGRALAQKFAGLGSHLALSDVNPDTLKETIQSLPKSDIQISQYVLDVADRAAFEGYAQYAIKEHGTIKVVINNAGVSVAAKLAHLSYDDFEWMFNINFWGMVYGSKIFLPHLLEQKESWLANVSSIFGIIASPNNGGYNATKFAIRGFTEALRQEVSHTGLHVASIHPGGIKTNIVRNGRYSPETFNDKEYKKVAEVFEARLARTSSEKAAEIIVKGLEKKKPRIMIGKDATMLDRIQRLSPSKYDRYIGSLMKRFLD